MGGESLAAARGGDVTRCSHPHGNAPGEKSRPRRRTDRRGGEHLGKAHAASGQFVDGGGGEIGGTETVGIDRALVVGVNEEDIGLRCGGGEEREAGREDAWEEWANHGEDGGGWEGGSNLNLRGSS